MFTEADYRTSLAVAYTAADDHQRREMTEFLTTHNTQLIRLDAITRWVFVLGYLTGLLNIKSS